MTDTEAGIVAIVYALALIVAVMLLWQYDIHRSKARSARLAEEDQHAADVKAWHEVPDITRELRPVPVVRREALPEVNRIEQAEAAGRAAELAVRAAQSNQPGRHRAADPRDIRRYDWRRDTE